MEDLNSLIVTLKVGEGDQFEAVCSRLGEIEADVARFCYHTAWRTKSEVFPLTWAQVDWNGGLIRLEPGTTKNREGTKLRSGAHRGAGVM